MMIIENIKSDLGYLKNGKKMLYEIYRLVNIINIF